jgi:endonuclease YncB( thermonuclease family)
VEWSKQDRYQRVLGKVLLDGQDINLKQIKAGLAWHYKRYDKDQRLADRRLYAEAQKAASLKGIGLWSDPRLLCLRISGARNARIRHHSWSVLQR